MARTERKKRLKKSRLAFAGALFIALFLSVVIYLPLPPADAPRVLVSVDRTLWNRVGFNRLTWVRALRDAGLRPVLIDFAAMDNPDLAADRWLDGMQGLILSGGGDVDPALYGGRPEVGLDVNPRRDAFELALLRTAEERGLPVLGICRGAQLINVHRGGTLGDFRADPPRFRRHLRFASGHAVTLEPGSRLAELFGTTRLDEVVTYHGQFVDRPGEGVRIVAHAPDGTPEAIEVDTGSPFGMLAVQWHAEVLPWDRYQAKLFAALRGAAAEFGDDGSLSDP